MARAARSGRDEWVGGVDVFALECEDCPIVMRWLAHEKTN
jgi:hypothetical protein